VVLTVRPVKAGFFRCTAEVLSSGVQANVENFEIIAR
jgi:acyl-coenzyme A thioesterase PaaI-like protein